MGFFRYFDTLNDKILYFQNSLGFLKGQIEDKKYFLEWGSNPQT